MPCYSPLKGYWSNEVNPSGKRSIVFSKGEALCAAQVSIPCGQCIGCRLERSRQWAIRCVHEASLYSENCFLTLTFNDSNIDPSGSLIKRDFQLFMKRLRKKFGSKIRYFHCGEYGSRGDRPHHHACIFNFDFPDKELWSIREGVKLYRSKILEDLWPYGFCTIGDVTFESAAYVARYVVKKINKNKIYPHLYDQHYKGRIPEYTTMSRRPGIGRRWFDQFKTDVFPHGYVVIRNGIKCKPPKYYENIYELTNPEKFGILKKKRERLAFNDVDNSLARLKVRESVKLAQARMLERGIET